MFANEQQIGQGSGQETLEDIFGISLNSNSPAPQAPQGYPETSPEQYVNQPGYQGDTQQPINNDQVRYQHFQSLYDKTRQENEQLRATVAQIQAAQQQQYSQTDEDDDDDAIPAPPSEPKPPYGFDATRINEVPEFQRYAMEYNSWIRDTQDYNQKIAMYAADKAKSAQQEMAKQFEQYKQEQEMQKQQQHAMSFVHQELGSKYGATPDVVQDFIDTFSKPESINLENLWRLYSISKGYNMPQQPQYQQPMPAQYPVQQRPQNGYPQQFNIQPPSAQFRQVNNAQQFYPPISNIPGVNQNPTQSRGDQFINMLEQGTGGQLNRLFNR